MIATFVLGLGGCHRDIAEPYTEWVRFGGAPQGDGAYAELSRLGVRADEATRDLKLRATLTDRQLQALDKRLAPILAELPVAEKRPIGDDYEPKNPLLRDPARIGWDLLARALEQRLTKALERQNYPAAVHIACIGIRLGYLVSSGDASDGLTGLLIADEMRAVISPHLRELDSVHLGSLKKAAQAVLVELPPTDRLAENERLAMLAAVQAVQDAYRSVKLGDLEPELGVTVRDSLEELASYRGTGEHKRAEFMRKFAEDAESEARWLREALATPTNSRQRDPIADLKITAKQPWNALARAFFSAGNALLVERDRSLARTRLLILTASLLQTVQSGGAAPPSLPASPFDLDPYTGNPMFYIPKGRDFAVYSAGPDGVDDGGTTDSSSSQPDLLLEGFH